jgi:glycosyltransferase involved in cell wall biosynthesis
LRAVWQLVRFFRRERPAIVHTHTAKAGAIGRIAARLAGVPICVHTFHGHVFQGHFSYAKSHFYLAIERLLACWTDALVAVSQSQGQELIAKFRVAPASKFVTISVALDLARYLTPNGSRGEIRKLAGCHANQPLIGWVGRMTAVKNPELFLDVASSIYAVDASTRFVMVGDGELRSSVEQKLSDRKLAHAVRILGWQNDLSGFYADLDVLVMTSKQEGTPLVLIEAMASGKVFVATNVGGIRDLMMGAGRTRGGLQIFENGILTDSSPFNLTSAIRYVLEHPDQAREMGCAGRAFASRVFSNQQIADDLERLYLSLLGRRMVS